jgi:hypothetical protein
MVPYWLLPPSFSRLMIVTVTGIVFTLLPAWFLALDSFKRSLVKQHVMRLLEKTGKGSR